MTNFATELKNEITRLARKELRIDTEILKKTVSTQRSELSALKRQVAELERTVKRLAKSDAKTQAAVRAEAQEGTGEKGHRFRAAGMAANRARLGLSAADFGLLVGTTGQSVYAWEAGRSKPRAKALMAIASLRGIGKKEALERLAKLKG